MNDGEFHFDGCIPEDDEDGCSCGTEYHFRFARDGVVTRGCNCGHDGMGLKWHFNCQWKNDLTKD